MGFYVGYGNTSRASILIKELAHPFIGKAITVKQILANGLSFAIVFDCNPTVTVDGNDIVLVLNAERLTLTTPKDNFESYIKFTIVTPNGIVGTITNSIVETPTASPTEF